MVLLIIAALHTANAARDRTTSQLWMVVMGNGAQTKPALTASDVANTMVDIVGHTATVRETLVQGSLIHRATKLIEPVDNFLDFFWGPVSAIQDLTQDESHPLLRARDGLLVIHALTEKYQFARGVLVDSLGKGAGAAVASGAATSVGWNTVRMFVTRGTQVAAVWWAFDTGWKIGSALDDRFKLSDRLVGISYNTRAYTGVEISKPLNAFKYPMATIFRHLESGQPMTPQLRLMVEMGLRSRGQEWPTFAEYPQYLRQTITERELQALTFLTREALGTLNEWGVIPSIDFNAQEDDDPLAESVLMHGAPTSDERGPATDPSGTLQPERGDATRGSTGRPPDPDDADPSLVTAQTQDQTMWPSTSEPAPFDSDGDGTPDMTVVSNTHSTARAVESPEPFSAHVLPEQEQATTSDELGRGLTNAERDLPPTEQELVVGTPAVEVTPKPAAEDELDFSGEDEAATRDHATPAGRPATTDDELDFGGGHTPASDELDFQSRDREEPDRDAEPDPDVVRPARGRE